jgi:hypothetical protein
MLSSFDACELKAVVTGTATEAAATDKPLWKKMDRSALNILMGCIASNLVVKVSDTKSSKEAWDALATEFGQSGAGSVMLWFRRLVKPYDSGNLPKHITDFQEAVKQLQIASFDIPDHITSAILLCTLPSDPHDPESWYQHIQGVKIEKDKTTLVGTAQGILDSKRRVPGTDTTPTEAALATALATLERSARNKGKLFCTNCRREGHITANCWASGGAKEGQGPKQKKGKKRAKEKAHNTQGGDGDENVESSFVGFEQSYVAPVATRILYSARDVSSTSTSTFPPKDSPTADDQAYSARMTGAPPIIIDSGTSASIHSDRSQFIPSSIKPTSADVRGFGNGKVKIEARGTLRLPAKLPNGKIAALEFGDAAYVPNSSPTLISVSRMDESKHYTLFGHGQCVVFHKDDQGTLLQNIISNEDIAFTGTKRGDRLYHLDTLPRSESSFSIVTSHLSPLELLHYRLGHLNYPAIRALVRGNLLDGIQISTADLNAEPPVCEACMRGKLHRASFPLSKTPKATRLLGRVHSDLWGPAPVRSKGGAHL